MVEKKMTGSFCESRKLEKTLRYRIPRPDIYSEANFPWALNFFSRNLDTYWIYHQHHRYINQSVKPAYSRTNSNGLL